MEFDVLVDEAFHFSGWDFSVFGERVSEGPAPWDYLAMAADAARHAPSMLDMGTGGGELLNELLDKLGNEAPTQITATESWAPNLPIARGLLGPRGVKVVQPFDDSELPLESAEFDLVLNKHESFDPAELRRILKPGRAFLTQQVGGRDLSAINTLLGAPPLGYAEWSLETAVQGLRDHGFFVERTEGAMVETRFTDIGALVGFLRVIEWQVPDFSVEKYREQLRLIHEQMQNEGPPIVHAHRFLIHAKSPGVP